MKPSNEELSNLEIALRSRISASFLNNAWREVSTHDQQQLLNWLLESVNEYIGNIPPNCSSNRKY